MILLKPNLNAFLTVAELCSVSLAAKKLGLTQAATTQRIQALEKELKISLFTRSRAGMKLTPEGQALLRYCHDANNLEGRLLSNLQKGKSKEIDLTIVGSASMITGRTVFQCQKVLAKWPQLNLHFSMELSGNRLTKIKKGLADLAFLFPQDIPQELDHKLVKPIEFILVAPTAWKNRSMREILEQERMFAYYNGDTTGIDYLRSFDLLKFMNRSQLFVNENLPILNLLELAVGYGVIAREIAQPLLKSGKIFTLNNDQSFDYSYALAWYPREEMPEYFQQIIDAIE